MGAELCLAHRHGGGGGIWGAPFGRHAALRLFHFSWTLIFKYWYNLTPSLHYTSIWLSQNSMLSKIVFTLLISRNLVCKTSLLTKLSNGFPMLSFTINKLAVHLHHIERRIPLLIIIRLAICEMSMNHWKCSYGPKSNLINQDGMLSV